MHLSINRIFALFSATRFRWQQHPVDDIEAITDWAIKDVYIGPPCDQMCSGHGSCHYPACSCDDGYAGNECYIWTARNPVSLITTFLSQYSTLNIGSWSLIEGMQLWKMYKI